eukprot:730465-Rhodomonas_salina.3
MVRLLRRAGLSLCTWPRKRNASFSGETLLLDPQTSVRTRLSSRWGATEKGVEPVGLAVEDSHSALVVFGFAEQSVLNTDLLASRARGIDTRHPIFIVRGLQHCKALAVGHGLARNVHLIPFEVATEQLTQRSHELEVLDGKRDED